MEGSGSYPDILLKIIKSITLEQTNMFIDLIRVTPYFPISKVLGVETAVQY